MIACPKCGCETLVTNKFDQVPAVRVAGDALIACRSGRAADALSNGLAWLGLWAANKVRNAHRCTHCQHTF